MRTTYPTIDEKLSEAAMALAARGLPIDGSSASWIQSGTLRFYPANGLVVRTTGHSRNPLRQRGLQNYVNLVERSRSSAGQLSDVERETTRGQEGGPVAPMSEVVNADQKLWHWSDSMEVKHAALALIKAGHRVKRCSPTHLQINERTNYYPTTHKVHFKGEVRAKKIEFNDLIVLLASQVGPR